MLFLRKTTSINLFTNIPLFYNHNPQLDLSPAYKSLSYTILDNYCVDLAS